MVSRIIIIIVLIALFFFGNFLIVQKGISVSRITQVFAAPAVFVKTIFYSAKIYPELNRLRIENEKLKSQISQMESAAVKTALGGRNGLLAKIYSTYPFNTQNKIILDAGKEAGVEKSSAVTVGGNILLGQITDVFNDYSIAVTIFDSDFKLPVGIGEENVPALFVGGLEPKLTLIIKDKTVKAGEEIYSTGKDFPYGMKIGEVKDVKFEATSAFQEAGIKLSYNFNELREVFVILK